MPSSFVPSPAHVRFDGARGRHVFGFRNVVRRAVRSGVDVRVGVHAHEQARARAIRNVHPRLQFVVRTIVGLVHVHVAIVRHFHLPAARHENGRADVSPCRARPRPRQRRRARYRDRSRRVRVDDDQMWIGRRVAAMRTKLPTRPLPRPLDGCASPSFIIAGGCFGAAVYRRNATGPDAAAARTLRIGDIGSADDDRQTGLRRRYGDAIRAAQGQRDAHRLRVVLTHAQGGNRIRALLVHRRALQLSPLISTQNRLSGSRKRCHAYVAFPSTATLTVAPPALGSIVTPLTTACDEPGAGGGAFSGGPLPGCAYDGIP